MRSWIHHTKGRHVRQARVGLGDLREEHISRQGFFGPVAMIYREHGPNEVVRVEGTLHPRRVADTARVEPSDMTDPRGMPEVMLSNADVSVAVSRRTAAMPYAYRNTDGDLLYFVHQGTGQFVTEFGRLAYEPGDYVLIPKGITFSVMPDAGDSHMLVVESPAPLSLTEHSRSAAICRSIPPSWCCRNCTTSAGRSATNGNCGSSTAASTAPSSTATTRWHRWDGRAICSPTS